MSPGGFTQIPNSLWHHAGFDQLKPERKILFIRILALVGSRFRSPDWTVPLRGPDARQIYGYGLLRHPKRIVQALGELVSAGLLEDDSSTFTVPLVWRPPADSADRQRRWYARRANATAVRQPGDTLSQTWRKKAHGIKEIRVEPDAVECRVSIPPLTPQWGETPFGGAQPPPEQLVLTPGSSADPIREIFELWTSLPGCEKHRSIEPHRRAIAAGVARFGGKALALAISRYSEVRSDATRYWSWGWSISELCSRGQGKWIERLLSPDWQATWEHKASSNGRRETLSEHYDRLLRQDATEPAVH